MNAVVEVETASMVPAKSANPTAEVVAHAKTVLRFHALVPEGKIGASFASGAGASLVG